MIIYTNNKEDENLMKTVLWDIGFDIYHKLKFKTKDVGYHSIYKHILNTILTLNEGHLLYQKIFLLTSLSPSNNHYLKQARWGGKYTPPETQKFQNMFKQEISKHENIWIIPSEHKYLDTDFTFWFERDDRDANNYFKVTLDVCEHGLYHNDKRTIPSTRDVYLNSDQDSKQLMEVSLSDKIGVFNNLSDLQGFIKNNCLKCKKSGYNRRCRAFYDLLENRVSKDGQTGYNPCTEKVLK